MCVIAYKPAGVNFPTYERLMTMWNRNPDGAGFMFPAEGNVHIEKGCMDFDTFMDVLAEADVMIANLPDYIDLLD